MLANNQRKHPKASPLPQPPGPASPDRKPWKTPRLQIFGTLRDITMLKICHTGDGGSSGSISC